MYFLLGMLFMSFVLPVLNGITEMIITWTELVKAKLSVSITEYGCQIQNLENSIKSSEEYSKTSAIGFSVPTEEEEVYDE